MTLTQLPHLVRLQSSTGKSTLLSVVRIRPGAYELIGAEGIPALDGYTLAFDLENLNSEFVNLDTNSDSFSCFGQSEHLSSGSLVIKGSIFQVKNLTALKHGLSKLRGELIDNGEF